MKNDHKVSFMQRLTSTKYPIKLVNQYSITSLGFSGVFSGLPPSCFDTVLKVCTNMCLPRGYIMLKAHSQV